MTPLRGSPRGPRHARQRRRHGLIYWLALTDAVLSMLCGIVGAIRR